MPDPLGRTHHHKESAAAHQRASPHRTDALSGCATSGLASSVFYTLVPVYAQSGGTSLAAISTYMATAIFGGLVFRFR